MHPNPSRAARFALLAVLALAGPAAGQSVPPDGEWRVLESAHFRVTYRPELEGLAREAVVVGERAWEVLAAELNEPPPVPVDLVVTDHVDYSNGFARALPSNRITVHARPPVGQLELGNVRDWMELVVVHELVHVFHLEETGGLGRLVRSLLGRVPLVWPVFPAIGTPSWNVEGLATHYESRLTGVGRIPGSTHEMIVRTAALEDRIPGLHELSAPNPAWPGGGRGYIYGGRFMRWIADRYGPAAHREIVEATGGSILPTFLFFDHVSRSATGAPFDDLYQAWREEATADAREAGRRIRAGGLTATEPVAGKGPYATAPRVSPDGRLLAFTADDYRSDPATRLARLPDGEVRTLARRNQFGSILGPASWLPDAAGLVVAQLEMRGPYRAWSDLWRIDLDGRETRLTRGERLSGPDVAPDGRRVAAVQNHAGAARLVVHDLETGTTRVVADAATGTGFDGPRWSPDGARIAVARFAGGRTDIVLVDVATGQITPVTGDDARDLAPAWSPDGRWLLWGSDRSGIPNIYAADVAGVGPGAAGTGKPGPVRRVTHLLTGGFDPEVSPDGRWLYLSVYHHDGWRIERLAFDPGAWPVAAPALRNREDALLPPPPDPATLAAGSGQAPPAGAAGGPSAPYSPWPTLRPYFWAPELRDPAGEARFLGGYASGEDVVGRHAWEAAAAVDLDAGWVEARGGWRWRGAGSPHVVAAASREWSFAGAVPVADGTASLYRRTDELRLETLFWRSRWRSIGWLRLGGEVEWGELVPRDHTAAEVEDAGHPVGRLATVAGASAGVGYGTARRYPLSVSREDGVSGSAGLGRWWVADDGRLAYDEVTGRLAGYLGVPAWGWADHVLAVRAAGLVRTGPRAFPRSLGGVPGSGDPIAGGGGAWLPVRGYQEGDRFGTRAWAASAEWRFPLYMRGAPGGFLGFSLTSLSGALFADLGDAWCTDLEIEGRLARCASAAAAPLASAGAELVLDMGVFHNLRSVIRAGVALPLSGGVGEPVAYVGLGPAF